jgi:dihydrodipicolinate synthase/N-acetylneuraminate lyase
MAFEVEAYRGVMVPLVTPFRDEVLDLRALEDLVQWLLAAGVRGFLALGTTGEAAHVTEDEAVQVVRVAVHAAAGRVPVLAGSGRTSVRATLEATQRLADAGADAAMVLTPYYYRAQMDGPALQRFYSAVAAASPVPLFVYHMPGVTGIDLDAETLADITRMPNVWGFKDSSTNGGPLAGALRSSRTCGLVGSGPRFLEGLGAGAAGGVLAIAHVIPEVCLEIHAAWREGRKSDAEAAQRRATDFARALRDWAVPGLKFALGLRGQPGGVPRQPLEAPPPDVRARIESALAAALGPS